MSVPDFPSRRTSLARRRALQRMMALGAAPASWLLAPHAWSLPAKTLQFPRDFGSHEELGTEWWYITGHVSAGGRPWGFQLTFFRRRVEATQPLQSAFAAKQLLLAHAALCDVQGQVLLHDQRMARAGMGLAGASSQDTAIHINDWRLTRASRDGQRAADASRYTATLKARDFALDLQMDTTQPTLLQGDRGLSRKGPLA